MRSRRFRKKIEIWQTIEVSDGFGGNTVNEMRLTSTWADIKSINNYKNTNTNFGINHAQLGIEVTVRKRNDLTYNTLNQFIVYAGEKYTILTFPENKNFDNSTITFIAVKEKVDFVPTLESIEVNATFDNYSERVREGEGTITSDNCQKGFIQTLL